MSEKPVSKTNAPLYANLFVAMVPIARAHGYALKGDSRTSAEGDSGAFGWSPVQESSSPHLPHTAAAPRAGVRFSLVAVPWADEVRPAEELVAAFTSAFYFVGVDGPAVMPHGRLCWTLAWPGACFVDLSVMPANPVLGGEHNGLRQRFNELADRLVLARRAVVALRGFRNKGTGMN